MESSRHFGDCYCGYSQYFEVLLFLRIQTRTHATVKVHLVFSQVEDLEELPLLTQE